MEAGTGMTTRLPADAGAEHAADVNMARAELGAKWWLSTTLGGRRRSVSFGVIVGNSPLRRVVSGADG